MAEIITMPKLGFDMAEGTLVRWVIAEGQPVQKGQVLAEIETDKATVEVESNASGILNRYLVEEGSVVPVGTAIAVIAAPGEDVKDIINSPVMENGANEKKLEVKAEVNISQPTSIPVIGMVKASPLARRMALEHKLDLGRVRGSGPEGRIVKNDIVSAMSSSPEGGKRFDDSDTLKQTYEKFGEMPAIDSRAEDRNIPVDKLRAIIGKRMVESKQQIPHFTITASYNAKPLVDLRTMVNDQMSGEVIISINDFLVKAVALTLRRYPNLNASLQGDVIIQHGRVNIGVAVSLENGLLTVVCKDPDQKPLRDIAVEVKEMAARARAGKVRPDDIQGSTFSISNLGMYDVEHFTAIINPPEAGILAVGSIQEVPVIENGSVQAGLRMKVTLSADHRMTDGAESARFLQTLGEFIQNPIRMLI